MRRSSLDNSLSSWNGSTSALLSIVKLAARPVRCPRCGSFAFSVPAQAGGDRPVTWITSSSRSLWLSFGRLGVLLGPEDDLGHALAVAQIDENDPAVVAHGIHPAGKRDGLADVGGAEFVAVVRAHGVAGKVSVIGCRLSGK